MIKKLIVVALFIIPAMAFAQTYPLISIHDLQYVDDQNLSNGYDSSLTYMGDTVQVVGVVIFNPCAYGLSTTGSRVATYIADSNATGGWTGMQIIADPSVIGAGSGPAAVLQLSTDASFRDNCVLGNVVKVTGILSSFSNNTQLNILPIPITVTNPSGIIPAAVIVPIDSFEVSDGAGGQNIQIPSGEKYEGVYVEMQNVRVVDVSVVSGGARINWSLQDNFGNKIKIRDMSGWVRNDTSDNFCTSSGSLTPAPFDTPVVNSVLAFVKGVIIEYKTTSGPYEYWLAPLTLNDIGPTTYAAPTVVSTSLSNPVPTTTQAQTVTANISDDQSVASAVLYYASGLSNNSFTSMVMTNIGGNNWQATIPAIGPDSTYVKYWIKATDNQGYYTNYPDSLGTNKFYLVKNSGITSIPQLQWNPLGFAASPYNNETISNMDVQGIVMSESGNLYDLGSVFIQSSNLPWNGISLIGTGLTTLHRGDKIKITKAFVKENFNITSLDSVIYTVLSTGNALPSAIANLNIDSVKAGKFNFTEPYESMLLKYDSAFVVNINPDAPSNFGEWSIYKNISTTSGLRCDDISNDISFGFNIDSLQLNVQLDYIYGELTYAFSNWKLLPRNRDDIAGFHVITIGIEEANSNNMDWKIYPNPVNNELTIQYSGNSKNLIIELVDAAGKKVIEQKGTFPNSVLNVQSLSSGTYILQLNDGTNTLHSKIVKLK
ncbi:MAG: T9SS C-terminal target domain-containing protein [Sphingobacteriales bacterium]|nr:MAG: T9SS C-terminal target domain-containing protein [Sphingobacteriales bacterium]